jgi:plastocyanin
VHLFRNRSTRGLLGVPLAAVLIGVPPAALPEIGATSSHRAAAFGRIEGTVIISSVLVARRPSFRIYNDPGPGALPPPAVRADSSDEMKNVVIYIGPAGAGAALAGSADPATRHATMTQQDETFRPHVLPVVRGTSVAFPNADDVYHNVFSLSSAMNFDLGRYPRGSSRSLTFGKAGRVDVFCHIHSDMNAVVLVLDNPYFTSPDAKGHFVIDSVPPGDYVTIGWHQRIKPVQHRVHVVAGESAKMVFTIPLPSPDSP